MNDENNNKAELRNKAEQQYLEKKKDIPADAYKFSKEEKLIQELEVHQIELEMQNEELKKSHEELEESRLKYYDLYDLAPCGYLTLDHLGIVKNANLTSISIFGIDKSKLLNRGLSNFIDQDYLDELFNFKTKCLKSLIKQSCEIKLKKNECPLWVELYGIAIVNKIESDTSILITIIDITKRKLSEESLLLKNKVFNLSLAGLSISDSEGFLKEVNSSFLEIWGFSHKDDVIGKPISYFLECEHDADAILTALNNTGSWTGGYTAKRSDGSIFNVYASSSVILGDNDKIVGYQSSVIDITERKKAEEELLNSEAQKKAILNGIASNIAFVNDKLEILWVNKKAADSVNMNMKNMIGQTCYKLWADLDQPCDNCPSLRAIQTKKTEHTLMFTPDGRVWDESGEPIFDHDGKLLGVVEIAQDVTEQRKVEQLLQQSQKIEAIGTLAGGIAHDFNNILTGIFGNISLARMKLPKGHPVLHYLEESERSIERATHLSGQLLTFAKGGGPIREDINLYKLVKDVVDFDLSGSNVNLVFEYSENLWEAEVDKGQIQQVFSNLTINGKQAMHDGGVLYISLENVDIGKDMLVGLKKGKYIKCMVRDEGIGIEHKILDKVFDPFFTTKELGRGLGLATVYSIIKKHDGYIKIDSELGIGTIFTLYLPASESQQLSETKQSEIADDSKIVQNSRILVMDDDVIVCNFLKYILEEYGFSVSIAIDGKQAIDMYKQLLDNGEPFDAVILDLTIPGGIGGKEVIKDILKINPKAKCIVSSGYANDPVMARYVEFGFKASMTKPYPPSKLLEVLNQVLKE